jgi:hypothetical protein
MMIHMFGPALLMKTHICDIVILDEKRAGPSSEYNC